MTKASPCKVDRCRSAGAPCSAAVFQKFESFLLVNWKESCHLQSIIRHRCTESSGLLQASWHLSQVQICSRARLQFGDRTGILLRISRTSCRSSELLMSRSLKQDGGLRHAEQDKRSQEAVGRGQRYLAPPWQSHGDSFACQMFKCRKNLRNKLIGINMHFGLYSKSKDCRQQRHRVKIAEKLIK